ADMGQLEQFHRQMREFDRKYKPEDYYDRRLREKREEEERKRRHEPPPQPTAQQQSPAERKAWGKDWNDWAAAAFNTFLLTVMAKGGWMHELLAEVIGTKAGDVRKHMLDEVATLRRELAEATAKLQERLARLPLVKAWDADAVHYLGDVVVHEGTTYQARRDTGKEPPHRDWILLAAAGCAGKDADRVVVAKHVGDQREAPLRDYSDEAVAKLPPAKDGARGLQGERGARGEAAPTIINWTIDHARYRAIPTMSDGTGGPPLELRGLFEQFLIETGGGPVELARRGYPSPAIRRCRCSERCHVA